MRLANVVYALSLAVVLLGCQSSLRDKPVSRSSSQSETTPAVPSPSFKAFIQNVSIYSVPNNRQDLAVSLVVSVVNSGEPTTLRAWMLEVDSQDPSLPSGLEPVHVNGVVDLPGTNGRRVDLGKEDLALKASASSVGTNSKMDGVLTFVLPKTSEQELANNSSSLVLHFQDALGNSYQTDKARIGSKAADARGKS